MNSVGKEFRYILPKLAANIALASIFVALGAISSAILANVAESFGFYSWLALTFVGGVFTVRALFAILTIGDKTVGLLMERFGIQQRLSKRRIAKDLVCIIAIILAAAAILPFLKSFGTIGTALQSIATIAAIATIFLFIYDMTRTLHQMVQEGATFIVDWFGHQQGEEGK